MATKMFFACAYGPVVRFSGKCATEADAARECFGTVDRVTVVLASSRVSDIRNYGYRVGVVARLREKHKALTGNDIESR